MSLISEALHGTFNIMVIMQGDAFSGFSCSCPLHKFCLHGECVGVGSNVWEWGQMCGSGVNGVLAKCYSSNVIILVVFLLSYFVL